MTYKFKYTILSISENQKTFEVQYESEGLKTYRMSLMCPYEGQSLEELIQLSAPITLWQMENTPVILPEIGLSGEIDPSVISAQSSQSDDDGSIDIPVQEV